MRGKPLRKVGLKMGFWECNDGTMVEMIFSENGDFVKFGEDVTAEIAEKVQKEISDMTFKKNVQIIDNWTICRQKEKYPTLVKEINKQDKYSGSSWYSLSPKAYEEWLAYCKQ